MQQSCSLAVALLRGNVSSGITFRVLGIPIHSAARYQLVQDTDVVRSGGAMRSRKPISATFVRVRTCTEKAFRNARVLGVIEVVCVPRSGEVE